MPGESLNTRDSYPRRRPPGHPVLGKAQVREDIGAWSSDPFPYSDFDSEGFGGLGATTHVVMFPGDPQRVAWDFQSGHPRPSPRLLGRIRGFTVPAPVPQTVSNLRRAELAAEEAGAEVDMGILEIFEGVSS